MTAPIWRIEIVKSMAFEQWANDYLTDIATLADAEDLSSLLLTFEKHMHATGVNFDYIRISSYIKDDRVFRHLAINEPGLESVEDRLPLYCTARMDMGTFSSDPARKYYRLPIAEAWQTNGLFSGATLTSWAGLIATYLVATSALGKIVTNAGHNAISASFNPQVQMRQLHRHRRKKIVLP